MLISCIFTKQSSHKKITDQNAYYGYIPKNGFVPDSATAIKISKAIWIPIYGDSEIESERPFKAELIHDTVWSVHGTLPEGWIGGTAVALIRKSDGKILFVTHDK